jgi:hypothetical protein
MLDMIAVAFQSDTTRISTFMFGNAVSGVNFRFLEGVTDSHHEISHHSNDPEKLRQYAVINRWHVEQYGYLLRKLREMQEGERSRSGQFDDPVRVCAPRRQQARSASLAPGARRDGRRDVSHPVSTWYTPPIRPWRICMCPCSTLLVRLYSVSRIAQVRFLEYWPRPVGTLARRWHPNRNSKPINKIRLSKDSTLTE